MIYLTSENNLKLDGLQCFYFYASWMPYHKKMVTMISKIEEKYNIVFTAIDTDNFKALCKRFEIEEIPTVLALKYGAKLKKIKVLVLTSAFKSAFADICNI